ncbi:MBL fold metallo-hydrolase [bacterium]|nr:MBL fold metallo-hydrolase [bacterium]
MKNSNGKFFVKFRGTRGSFPTPSKSQLEYGGNTACVEVNVNNNLIILDAGTGIIGLGEDLVIDHIASATTSFDRTPINATLLLSHIHQDHIQGFPFFKPAHLTSTNLQVFGYSDFDEGLDEILSDLLFSKSFPLDLGDIAANLNITNISGNDEIIILSPDNKQPIIKTVTCKDDFIPQGEEVIISCYKSYAHPQNGVMSYKIAYKDKSVVYATDREGYIGGDKKLARFARNCNLLIHDAQYTEEDYSSTMAPKQGFGHSTFDMALDIQNQSHAKQLAFFHLEPSYSDEKISAIETEYKNKEPNCFVAKEGLEIEII